MKKLKPFILGLFLIPSLGLLAIFLFVQVYKNDIKSLLIEQLNQYLNTEVLINQNDIQVGFFNTFPKLNVEFKNLCIKESIPGSDENVACVESVFFAFNLSSLFSKSYNISSIKVNGATLNAGYYLNKGVNYKIFKDNPEQSSSQLSFNIAELILKNIDLHYFNQNKQIDLKGFIESSELSGNFSSENTSLTLKLKALVEQLEIDDDRYFSNVIYELNGPLSLEADLLKLNDFQLKLNESDFLLNGTVNQYSIKPDFDLRIESGQNRAKALKALLPESMRSNLDDYEIAGSIDLVTKIKGVLTTSTNPYLELDFTASDAFIKHKPSDMSLESINFSSNFHNGQGRNLKSSVFSFKDFKARFRDEEVLGNLTLSNLDKPRITLEFKGNVNTDHLDDLWNNEGIRDVKGRIFAHVFFNGRLDDLSNTSNIYQSDFSGNIILNEVSFLFEENQQTFSELDGNFRFYSNELIMEHFQGKLNQSDFTLKGRFSNISRFLFIENEILRIDADFKSEYINLEDFVSDSEGEQKADSSILQIPDFLALKLKLSCKDLEYKKFHASNTTGEVLFADNNLFLHNVKMEVMDGSMKLNCRIHKNNKDHWQAISNADFKGIDIKELFIQFSDFGQNYFTHKNIKGRADADVQSSFIFNPDGTIKMEDLVILGDLKIRDGEIMDYKPIQKLAGFIKIKKMEHLTFTELNNTILIEDETIHIPEMNVNSSAFEMSISGTHTFENYADYQMRINISELLFGKKQKRIENEFGVVEYDDMGRMNLFILMQGNEDDLKFRYDKKAVTRQFTRNLKKEWQEFKQLFKKDSIQAESKEYELIWDE